MAFELTPQQKIAVTDRGGNLLISAAAGSGKTKVLVDRLMHYLSQDNLQVNIDDFLIITYTKAAASELRGKIADKLNEKLAENPQNKRLRQQLQRLYLAKISTVHSFCSDLLKEHAYRLDIPGDFRIAEEEEANQMRLQVLESLLNEAYDSDEPDADFLAFVDSHEFGRSDENLAKIVISVYNSAICHMDANQWLDECLCAMDVDGVTDAAQTIWGQYLMSELKAYLALQIDAMTQCYNRALAVSDSEGPAGVFEKTIAWLSTLKDYQSWDEIVSAKEFDYGRLTFKKSFGDSALQEQMKAIRDACKKGVTSRLSHFTGTSDWVLLSLKDAQNAAKGLVALVRKFMVAFEKKKRAARLLDYADLEHKTLDLLLGKRREAPTQLANEISTRFCEIMVDEYQDSNQVQDAIFHALTCQKHNCFMVGDVKQSIYQFRLADPEIFLEKYNAYPFAQDSQQGQGRKVLLSHNFRSGPAVIEAVNHVFTTCMSKQVGGLTYDENEKLHLGKSYSEIPEREVSFFGIDVKADTYAEEAAFVANEIVKLTDGTHLIRDGEKQRPIRPDDIAILLRSPGSVGQEYRLALESKGIRCCTGNGSDLLKTEEIAALRSFLQAISNPQLDIPVLSVVTSRVFGFTGEDLAAVRAGNRNVSLYDALSQYQSSKAVNFVKTWEHLRQYSRLYCLSQLITEIFSVTGFDSIFAADKYGAERMENLQIFCKLISDFESTSQRTLDQFLDYLSSMESRGLVSKDISNQPGSVIITSIHKSKGLEYPVVFLCGLSRTFNTEDAREQVLCHKHLGLGLGSVDGQRRVRFPTIGKQAIAQKILEEGVSQEMLVLYVAMTRAKDRLIMTYAVKNLEKKVAETVNRMDLSDPLLLTGSAVCPGDWILYSALKRSESGALFQLGGYPACRTVSEIPWNVQVVECGDSIATVDDTCEVPALAADVVSKLSESLAFTYPYRGATILPSKLTATELKGRIIDGEIAQDASIPEKDTLKWRKPSDRRLSGVQYGTAIHSIMQYICYDKCTSRMGLDEELERLVRESFISLDEAACADRDAILCFFNSEVGTGAISCKEVLREFKFTLLDDASLYFQDAQMEQVLLQGVVDLAIVDDDGIIVVDFKTDYVTPENIEDVTAGYHAQVCSYAKALEKIYKKPVKQALLYYFRLRDFVSVL